MHPHPLVCTPRASGSDMLALPDDVGLEGPILQGIKHLHNIEGLGTILSVRRNTEQWDVFLGSRRDVDALCAINRNAQGMGNTIHLPFRMACPQHEKKIRLGGIYPKANLTPC